MKEAARVPSEAMSAAQFRHGAVEVVDRRQAIVFFMNDRGDAQREDAWAYVAELVALDTTVVVIGPEPPSDVRGPRLLHVRAGDTLGEAAPIAEIVPIQLLAAQLAKSAGFEAGGFRNTTPVVSRIPVRTGG
jgi:glucosamine 6-phosphate synthetase-like amidotransferase/phosphosugar isomerase protein